MDGEAKHSLWLFFLTVPLVLGSFAAGMFFRGTDNILILPHIACMIGFAVIAFYRSPGQGWALPRGPVILAILAYWLYVVLSISWSTNPYNSTLFAIIFSVLPFMFFALVMAPEPYKWLQVHMGALAVGIAAVSVWAGVQFFVLEPGRRVHHPMLNPNNLAVVFNMAMFPALALYLCARERLYMIVGFVLSALFLFAMLTTQSRGGLIAFLIVLVPFLIFIRGQAGMNWRRLLVLVVMCVSLFAIVHNFSTKSFGGSVMEVVAPQSGVASKTVTERQLIWASTWDLIQDHFWGGTGLGTFTYYYPRYRHSKDYSDGYFAHMDPLQFWAEMGVLAPILFYLILVLVLIRTIRATRASTPCSPERAWMYACFCGLLALTGHAHISFHLYMPINLFLAAFLLAGWFIASEFALNCPRSELLPVHEGKKTLLYAAMLVFVLAPLGWMVTATAGVHYLNQVERFMQAGKVDEASRALEQARRFARTNYSSLYDVEAKYRLHLLNTRRGQMSPDERRRIYEEAQSNIDQAITLNPGFVNLLNRKALIYFAGIPDLEPQGREKAQELLEKALAGNPILLDARIGLAHVHYMNGDKKKALAVMQDLYNYPVPKTFTAEQYQAIVKKFKE
ncbi:MAG: O-antigen ligase family protein [Rhodospirillales bacterium]|nr:O-antigen ligase family protein [Rhodospirillales bacterium]